MIKLVDQPNVICSCFHNFLPVNCVFRRRNQGKVPLQALELDRQPVSQTRTLTPNPNREMRLTIVSLIYITIEVTFSALT